MIILVQLVMVRGNMDDILKKHNSQWFQLTSILLQIIYIFDVICMDLVI